MRRRHFVALPLVASLCRMAGAQVAVPFYAPHHFVQGLYRYGYQPRAEEFARHASALAGAAEALCAAPASGAEPALARARAAWAAAAEAWDGLSGVAIGPLVERRSLLQIDFFPPRPHLIERALRSPPADLDAMERVGAPAKGLPALEWLLWTRPVQPATPACRYAALVARDIEREALALQAEIAELAARDWAADETAAVAAMDQALNQWVGGLERLRWTRMEKPLRAAAPGQAPEFARAASDRAAAAWSAAGSALFTLGSGGGDPAPAPGAGLVPWETYLRGRGLNPLADRIAEATSQARQQLRRARPGDGPSVLAAAEALDALKRLAQAEMAPALKIHIGFSDSDGD